MIRRMTGQFGARTGTGHAPVRKQPVFGQFAGLGAVRRQPVFGQFAGLGTVPVTAPLSTDPDGPPADATLIAPNVYFDLKSGNLWYNTTKLAIIPGVITAVAIKVIMFGGGVAAKAAKAKFLGAKA